MRQIRSEFAPPPHHSSPPQCPQEISAGSKSLKHSEAPPLTLIWDNTKACYVNSFLQITRHTGLRSGTGVSLVELYPSIHLSLRLAVCSLEMLPDLSFRELQIWDTAGQERFRTITQSYYRSANGAILAYDITKRSSFLSVPHWIGDVRKYAGSNIVQLLIGNKSDLSELREVPHAEAQRLAEHYDILCAIETSAKDSSNVEEAFLRVATELIMRHGGPLFSEKSPDHIQLNSKDIGEGWGCGC
ncbi:ras-related protein Rab-43 isoform X1 [Cebus imitator]|uniref:ras-related protein Rab-43 isoform X1 n=1 Tax=Cebus imitator TaxID=2715852 RepID=UPI0018989FF1|nr:ras-related protein Rab-43 isoform X1 [Cebus imitator]